MTNIGCRYESELFESLTRGRWPDASTQELREHVAACRDCRDLAAVAGAMIEDRRHKELVAAVPPPGAVWWRMQLRLEREMKEEAARTVGRAHGAVVAATLVLVTAILAMTSLLRGLWHWATGALPHISGLASVVDVVPLTGVALIALVLIVFAPIAVYLAVADD